MHDHIKKLLDRGYATKNDNMQFSPTNLVADMILKLSIFFPAKEIIYFLYMSA